MGQKVAKTSFLLLEWQINFYSHGLVVRTHWGIFIVIFFMIIEWHSKVEPKKENKNEHTFKVIHNLAPPYHSDFLHIITPVHARRYSSIHLSVPPVHLNTRGRRALSNSAPMLWNSLLPDLRNSLSLTALKSKLKTRLFKRAYSLSWQCIIFILFSAIIIVNLIFLFLHNSVYWCTMSLSLKRRFKIVYITVLIILLLLQSSYVLHFITVVLYE